MLGRVVADALQRELAASPPGGEPAAVLARALRLAADACALNAAMPALDDFTALRARCAAPNLVRVFLFLNALIAAMPVLEDFTALRARCAALNLIRAFLGGGGKGRRAAGQGSKPCIYASRVWRSKPG